MKLSRWQMVLAAALGYTGWVDGSCKPVSEQWWKEAVVYQVYPASFKDSDGNGWGDISGITEKLDHIKDLGADVIWLSPFYDSPMVDMGYDISNYSSVNSIFGTMEDIDEFIAQVHKRDMKCIFDLVINHSSDQHQWFQSSKRSVDDDKRDWYIWRPPQEKDGSRYPPNNWSGSSNGSAWKWDENTKEYYLHIFTDKQPDFNWDNKVTREALYDQAMRFWLNKGIDGFRMDVFRLYSKTPGLPDVPANDSGFYDGSRFYDGGPNIHKYLHEMNQKVLSHYDTLTVGEAGYSYDINDTLSYVGESRQEINMVFLKQMTEIGHNGYIPVPWNFTEWRKAIEFIQSVGRPESGDGWNTVFLENHDVPRSISKFCDDSPEFRVASGKLLSMFLGSLSGTLFLYQGQEIGMVNVPESWEIGDFRDRFGIDYYDDVKNEDGNLTEAVSNLQKLGRDNARMPFNWDDGDGFSVNDTTWISAVHKDINLKHQLHDKSSVYRFWRDMLKLRNSHKDVFTYGSFQFEEYESEKFLVFTKQSCRGGRSALVVLNFGSNAQSAPIDIPEGAALAMHTHDNVDSDRFEPFEGRLYWVTGSESAD